MNKSKLIQLVIAKLGEEQQLCFKAAQAARAEATDEQSKAENKYDTRGLEASYLARGQSQQAIELDKAIAAFKELSPRTFDAGDPIDLGALVELQQDDEHTVYFIGPRAGGTEIEHGEQEILVITPQSPLGQQLLGKKQGEELKLKLPGGQNKYRVASVT